MSGEPGSKSENGAADLHDRSSQRALARHGPLRAIAQDVRLAQAPITVI
jgi:hypothetical protein